MVVESDTGGFRAEPDSLDGLGDHGSGNRALPGGVVHVQMSGGKAAKREAKDAQEKFKPDNIEVMQEKASKWKELSAEERKFVNESFKAYQER